MDCAYLFVIDTNYFFELLYYYAYSKMQNIESGLVVYTFNHSTLEAVKEANLCELAARLG